VDLLERSCTAIYLCLLFSSAGRQASQTLPYETTPPNDPMYAPDTHYGPSQSYYQVFILQYYCFHFFFFFLKILTGYSETLLVLSDSCALWQEKPRPLESIAGTQYVDGYPQPNAPYPGYQPTLQPVEHKPAYRGPSQFQPVQQPMFIPSQVQNVQVFLQTKAC